MTWHLLVVITPDILAAHHLRMKQIISIKMMKILIRGGEHALESGEVLTIYDEFRKVKEMEKQRKGSVDEDGENGKLPA
ncbi:hypothetical protein HanRHA438_Chr09g0396871 [Helianthus annuus]|nr:hypothetical protein HanRHA438_Chr09g0396871 [Helianthus annuus]